MAAMIALVGLGAICIGCLLGVSLTEQIMSARSRRQAQSQRVLNAAWQELLDEQELMGVWREAQYRQRPIGMVIFDPFSSTSPERGKKRPTDVMHTW